MRHIDLAHFVDDDGDLEAIAVREDVVEKRRLPCAEKPESTGTASLRAVVSVERFVIRAEYGKTLDAVVLKGSREPRRPKNLCLDKGYDCTQAEQEAPARGVKIAFVVTSLRVFVTGRTTSVPACFAALLDMRW